MFVVVCCLRPISLASSRVSNALHQYPLSTVETTDVSLSLSLSLSSLENFLPHSQKCLEKEWIDKKRPKMHAI